MEDRVKTYRFINKDNPEDYRDLDVKSYGTKTLYEMQYLLDSCICTYNSIFDNNEPNRLYHYAYVMLNNKPSHDVDKNTCIGVDYTGDVLLIDFDSNKIIEIMKDSDLNKINIKQEDV